MQHSTPHTALHTRSTPHAQHSTRAALLTRNTPHAQHSTRAALLTRNTPHAPLAVRPQEEDNKNSGFWDSFTTKWQQATGAESGVAGEAEQSGQGYVSEGGANEDPSSFKWDFVTNKLAELKSITKTT
uniref:Uncharacterized protein n=1 Tax=Electrophorus electricus TaxID=8005 RepID=A0AAY5F1S4_ELEEL